MDVILHLECPVIENLLLSTRRFRTLSYIFSGSPIMLLIKLSSDRVILTGFTVIIVDFYCMLMTVGALPGI